MIACGRGGGIVNMNYFGEIAYTGVAKESINRAGDLLNQILKERGAELIERFENAISEQRVALLAGFNSILSQERQRAFEQLSEIEVKLVDDLRELSNSAIAEWRKAADVVAGKRLADLEGIFGASIVKLVQGLVFVFGFAGVVGICIFVIRANGQPGLRRVVILIGGVAMTVFASRTASHIYVDRTCKEFQEDAMKAVLGADMQWLYGNAKAMARDCDFGTADAHNAAAEIGAEILLAPSDPSTEKGQSKINELLSKAIDAQSGYFASRAERHPLLDAWIASLLWHHTENRTGEFVSANYAASAIEVFHKWRDLGGSLNSSIPAGFLSAVIVLDGYLELPIVVATGNADGLSSIISDESSENKSAIVNMMPPLRNNDDLRKILERGKLVVRNNNVANYYFERKQLHRNLSRSLLNNFSAMLVFSTRALSSPPGQARTEALAAANAIVESSERIWGEALRELRERFPASIEDRVTQLMEVPVELVSLKSIVPTADSGWVKSGPTIDIQTNPLLSLVGNEVSAGRISKSRGESFNIFILGLSHKRAMKFQEILDTARYSTLNVGDKPTPRELYWKKVYQIECSFGEGSVAESSWKTEEYDDIWRYGEASKIPSGYCPGRKVACPNTISFGGAVVIPTPTKCRSKGPFPFTGASVIDAVDSVIAYASGTGAIMIGDYLNENIDLVRELGLRVCRMRGALDVKNCLASDTESLWYVLGQIPRSNGHIRYNSIFSYSDHFGARTTLR